MTHIIKNAAVVGVGLETERKLDVASVGPKARVFRRIDEGGSARGGCSRAGAAAAASGLTRRGLARGALVDPGRRRRRGRGILTSALARTKVKEIGAGSQGQTQGG